MPPAAGRFSQLRFRLSPAHTASAYPSMRRSNVIATIGTNTRFHADFSGGEERGGGFIY